MKVIEIKDITKKNIPLHYRNEFKGSAVFEYLPQKQEESPVEFTLEHAANGDIDVSVRILNKINYPLLPALKSLKAHIRYLEKQGKL
ncbi:MAG: hypothetical protein R6V86_02380 [Spirochaetia bacterium]